MSTWTRREFVGSVLGGVAALPLGSAGLWGQQAGPRRPVTDVVPATLQYFPLAQVRLSPGIFFDMMQTNRAWLMSLPNERLAYSFQVTAGLTPSGKPYGGWEQPGAVDGHPVRLAELRGHFCGGHYLSACAQQYAGAGDEEIKAKADGLVATLAECQRRNGNGYLSAFPEEEFDRLREGRPVWAPFYTLHKIMAGLLDMHTLGGNSQALELDVALAGWVERWTSPLSDAEMQRVLQEEFGGMGEVLCNLAAATNDRRHLALARRFEKSVFLEPLAAQRDELKGLHANTHIPQVIAAARAYELTGDERYRTIAGYFWNEIATNRAYATGGTSNGEYWQEDTGRLTLSTSTEECCCGYNMLKLTRHIHGWRGEARAMDYYERTLYNSRLGTQDKKGMLMYFLPLSAGSWKTFGTAEDSFWCCTGTGSEEYAKLGGTIYAYSGARDAASLYVNLFIPSELDWKEQGVRVTQTTGFPAEAATTLTVRTAQPRKFDMNLRIPYWIAAGGGVRINGVGLEAFATPGSYLTLTRTWHDGDKVELSLPMRLHAAELNGTPNLQAPMYGPLVLATRLGSEGLTPDLIYGSDAPRVRPGPAPQLVSAGDVAEAIEPAGAPLAFQTRRPAAGQAQPAGLAPLYQVTNERYAVYCEITAPPTAGRGGAGV